MILIAMLSKEVTKSNRKDLGEIQVPAKECHPSSGSARMKPLATEVADRQHTLKGIRDRAWD